MKYCGNITCGTDNLILMFNLPGSLYLVLFMEPKYVKQFKDTSFRCIDNTEFMVAVYSFKK